MLLIDLIDADGNAIYGVGVGIVIASLKYCVVVFMILDCVSMWWKLMKMPMIISFRVDLWVCGVT